MTCEIGENAMLSAIGTASFETARFLAGVPLLAEAPQDTIARLAERTSVRRYGPLESVPKPGMTDGFLIVAGGTIYVMMGPNGSKCLLLAGVFAAGEVIDISLIQKEQRGKITSGSVGALVIHVPQEAMAQVITGTPAVAEAYIRLLTRRLHEAYQQTAENVWNEIPDRLCALLQRLAAVEGQRDQDMGGVWLNRPPTQEMLAQMMGSARETVNRDLILLAKNNRIVREGRRIFVRDRV